MVNDKHEILLNTNYIEQGNKKYIDVDDLTLLLQEIVDQESQGYHLPISSLLGYFIRLRSS